jgi:hypothetical protein
MIECGAQAPLACNLQQWLWARLCLSAQKLPQTNLGDGEVDLGIQNDTSNSNSLIPAVLWVVISLCAHDILISNGAFSHTVERINTSLV